MRVLSAFAASSSPGPDASDSRNRPVDPLDPLRRSGGFSYRSRNSTSRRASRATAIARGSGAYSAVDTFGVRPRGNGNVSNVQSRSDQTSWNRPVGHGCPPAEIAITLLLENAALEDDARQHADASRTGTASGTASATSTSRPPPLATGPDLTNRTRTSPSPERRGPSRRPLAVSWRHPSMTWRPARPDEVAP